MVMELIQHAWHITNFQVPVHISWFTISSYALTMTVRNSLNLLLRKIVFQVEVVRVLNWRPEIPCLRSYGVQWLLCRHLVESLHHVLCLWSLTWKSRACSTTNPWTIYVLRFLSARNGMRDARLFWPEEASSKRVTLLAWLSWALTC